jgi:hypothetical protein
MRMIVSLNERCQSFESSPWKESHQWSWFWR